jgi:hypothetical protein
VNTVSFNGGAETDSTLRPCWVKRTPRYALCFGLALSSYPTVMDRSNNESRKARDTVRVIPNLAYFFVICRKRLRDNTCKFTVFSVVVARMI